jgi:dienelactone hydrolase
VYLPKHAAGPFEPLIFWPPGGPSLIDSKFRSSMLRETDWISPSERPGAVPPVFKGGPEREGTGVRQRQYHQDSSMLERDLTVDRVKDMRRTIDYIETRTDMKADRIGFYGVSWGGEIAPLPLAIEPRSCSRIDAQRRA